MLGPSSGPPALQLPILRATRMSFYSVDEAEVPETHAASRLPSRASLSTADVNIGRSSDTYRTWDVVSSLEDTQLSSLFSSTMMSSTTGMNASAKERREQRRAAAKRCAAREVRGV